MKSIKEVRDWLIENRTDEWGNLDLAGLDFSEVERDVYISHMTVRHTLFQNHQEVEGNLFQGCQKVGGTIIQDEAKK